MPLLALFLLCFAFAKEPEPVALLRVIDGDTIKIAENGRNVSVRLWGIDAPEMARAHRHCEHALECVAINDSALLDFGLPNTVDCFG